MAKIKKSSRESSLTCCGDFVPFFAYIYGAIYNYRQRLINFDKEVRELKAKIDAK